jgi:hypothetical protein
MCYERMDKAIGAERTLDSNAVRERMLFERYLELTVGNYIS